jgi:hypothetical protein
LGRKASASFTIGVHTSLAFWLRRAYRSGYAVLAATVVLTVLAWLYVLLA